MFSGGLFKSYKFWCIVLVVILFGLSGCATNETIIPDLGKSKAEIILSPGKFRVIKTVSGEASSSFLFWIDIPLSFEEKLGIDIPLIAFDLGDPKLHEQAMRDLHSKHDLRGKPQILHNFLEEWTLANYLGLFAIVKVEITAEVIEFTE